MGLRWHVSLTYLRGRLLQALGELERAKIAFRDCGSCDVTRFGIHLSTKTTEAWYHAGRIAYCLSQPEEARQYWQAGIEYGNRLLGASLGEILINRDFPNRFNYGDGVREYTVAWDNIARCANGVHFLNTGPDAPLAAIDACLQSEYRTVLDSLVAARSQLQERTLDLTATRSTLLERTIQLEQTLAALESDVDTARQLLHERTNALDLASATLTDRTSELVRTRADLEERTRRLETTAEELELRSKELALRTEALDATSAELARRTAELVYARAALVERTRLLEQANETLVMRTAALDDTNASLVDRSERLEAALRELDACSRLLSDARTAIDERDARLGAIDRELRQVREGLAEKTSLEEQCRKQLEEAHSSPFRFALRVIGRRWFSR
jgi:hypothetical protein